VNATTFRDINIFILTYFLHPFHIVY